MSLDSPRLESPRPYFTSNFVRRPVRRSLLCCPGFLSRSLFISAFYAPRCIARMQLYAIILLSIKSVQQNPSNIYISHIIFIYECNYLEVVYAVVMLQTYHNLTIIYKNEFPNHNYFVQLQSQISSTFLLIILDLIILILH